MVQYILNLILTYFVAMALSTIVITCFISTGNWGKKITAIVISSIALIGLFYWGNNIGNDNYIWWFIGIILLNFINAIRYEKKKIWIAESKGYF